MKTNPSLTAPEINEIVAFQANCLFEEKKLKELITFMTSKEK